MPRFALASRDRFGIKPLVISRTADAVAFASEPQALFAGGLVTPDADLAAIGQWLTPAPVSRTICTETGKDRADARAKCVSRNPFCHVADARR